MHDSLLANRPESASHNADICPFCVDKATEDAPTTSRNPPASGGQDASKPEPNEHGGRDTTPMSDTNKMISEETHTALLTKAVADATSVTEKALETKTTEAASLSAQVEKLTTENAELKSETARLNGELDTAQVGLTAANEKVAQLESDIAKRDEDLAKAEIASKRAEQVTNLKLYDAEYVAERASAWAELSDTDWASRLEEWNKLAKPADAPNTTDSASAMSGTSGDLTKEPSSTDTASGDQSKKSARRAALGLS